VIARYKSEKLRDATKDMKIVPVNFNSEHKTMLGHCKMILEQEPGKIAINPDRYDKLIIALRTAVDNDGTLDKEATSYDDIFDAFRLAMKFYHFGDSSS
jgi:hypothetical protein